jgi:F-type H+-transporting ATPase subunit delta
MEKITTAKQYAKALFDACTKKSLIDQVASELKIMEETLKAEKDFNKLLIYPEVPIAEKQILLKQVMPEGFAQETIAFINLLLTNQLLGLLPNIHDVFIRMRFEAFGIVIAVVQTPKPLTAVSKARLANALKTATQREIVITEEIHPELISGVRIIVGDRILDGSITGRLNRIKESILAIE